jgi:cytochrome c oxidase subunit 2
MAIILGLLTLVLLYIVIVQISKASDLIKSLRSGDEKEESFGNSALFTSIIGFGVLVYSIVTCFVYGPTMLPKPASEQGVWINDLMNVTIVLTGVVFIITQALLFWFVYKYHYRKGRKAYFFADNNKLEVAWTVVPAIVLTFLIGFGIQKWFKIFSPAPKDAVLIEATGKQYAWSIRYSGADHTLGKRDFSLVNPDNELGINWNDAASHDDFMADEIVLPVNKPVSINVGALDVIHNFWLPHFRLMMSAVPGVPTHLWFRPTITTEEMRKETNNPNFEYVVACNKLCGSGHYNMKKKVRVVSQEEYEKWFSEQKSYYATVVKPAMESGTFKMPVSEVSENTPAAATSANGFSGKLSTGFELVGAVNGGVENKLVNFIQSDKQVAKDIWFSFDRLLFETGKSTLKPSSQEQLKNISEIMKAFPAVEIKLGGYTDNVGDQKANLKLSDNRAKAVMAELIKLGVAANRIKAEGYGDQFPVATNETDAGRQQNRRIDIRVTKK